MIYKMGRVAWRRVVHRRKSQLADGAEQRGAAAPWVRDAIGPCLAQKSEAACNRRMRKIARPAVWEGAGAQSPALDPITLADVAGRNPLCTTFRNISGPIRHATPSFS